MNQTEKKTFTEEELNKFGELLNFYSHQKQELEKAVQACKKYLIAGFACEETLDSYAFNRTCEDFASESRGRILLYEIEIELLENKLKEAKK
jgi:K+/H+ antiporter YhaU regulatory subunit KhtT